MTVVNSKRIQSELIVKSKTETYLSWVIKILRSKKNIRKKYYVTNGVPIMNLVRSLLYHITLANYIELDSDEDNFNSRMHEHDKSFECIFKLEAEFMVIHKLNYIKSKSYDYMCRALGNIRKCLKNWRNSDIRRFMAMKEREKKENKKKNKKSLSD